MMSPNFKQYAERSVLVEFEFTPAAFLDQICQAFPEAKVRPGLKTVLITFPDFITDLSAVIKRFPKLSEISSEQNSKTITIEITYDGEDLALAAKLAEISVEELIGLHQSTLWRVGLIGFAPGFPYLLPENNQEVFAKIGRLATPRAKVAPGSVGLAAGMSCIYPSSSPGGWHLIGNTEAILFDPAMVNPALLTVGDKVRFEAIS